MHARIRWIYPLLILTFILAACTPGGASTPAPVATQTAGDATPAADATNNNTGDAEATPTAVPDVVTDGPGWATALRAALEACAEVGRDQLCYGQGPVTVTSADGAAAPALNQPGDVADLAAITGLSVGAGDDWGVAVFGLSAGIDDPEQVALLVVMGPAEISALNTAVSDEDFAWSFASVEDAQARNPEGTPAPAEASVLPPVTELEPPQSLTFRSGPDAGDAPSGLFLLSPWEGDMAAVQINGATIALGSMAFIESADGTLTVGTLEGGSLVTVGEATFAVPAGTQTTVPENGGVASGPAAEVNVLDPRADAIARAVAQYGLPPAFDPRADAISQAVDQYGQSTDPRAEAIQYAVDQYGLYVARYYAQKYRRAINKCTNPSHPQARYVYNVMYWDTLIDQAAEDTDMVAALGPNGVAELKAGAERCLSFELDFDSTVDFTSPKVSYVVEVKAEGVPVHLHANGLLGETVRGTITHPRFEVTGDEAMPCPSTNLTPDGTLLVSIVFLRIYYNELELMVQFWPDVAAEQISYSCPNANPILTFAWSPVFYQAHQEELDVENQGYRFYDWQVYENEHFAETIYDTDVPLGPGIAHVNTWMVMVHTPGQ